MNHIVEKGGAFRASYVLFWRNSLINGKWEPRIIAWKHAGLVAYSKKGALYKVEWLDKGIKRVVESIKFFEVITPFDIEIKHRAENGNYTLQGLTTPYQASSINL